MKTILATLIALCTLALTPTAVSASDQPEQMLLRFVGVIDHSDLRSEVTALHRELFEEPAKQGPAKRAEHIEIYIGKRFVADGKFVPPSEYDFSKEHLAAFKNFNFPQTGCRISRQHFPDDTFAVLLVDATEPTEPEQALGCVYAAILTGLGVTLDGTPKISNEEALLLIKESVAALR